MTSYVLISQGIRVDFTKVIIQSRMLWHIPVTPTLGRLRQIPCKVEASLGYIQSMKTARAAKQDLVSKINFKKSVLKRMQKKK